jgi:hypothetical protein
MKRSIIFATIILFFAVLLGHSLALAANTVAEGTHGGSTWFLKIGFFATVY